MRTNGMTVYLLLSLRNTFTLMSVSSSVDNQSLRCIQMEKLMN